RMKDEKDSSFILHPSSFYAVSCALQMQQAMLPFAAITTPSGVEVSLGIKVAVTAGPVRRFLVGNPDIQYLDVLAGHTLDRMARIEHLAQRGEILAGPEIVAQLGERLEIAEWRFEAEAKAKAKAKAEAENRIAVITGLTFQPSNLPTFPPSNPPTLQPSNLPTLQPSHLPTLQPSNLPTPLLRSWLQPAVYERLQAGGGRFLAELRSAVALFISFHGLDYDEDDAAGDKLDAYIRWVQGILSRYDGNILQLTIGDKGSYMYISFGAPVSHGDDASRAIAAALELRDPPPDLNFITANQIGLSQGRMRAGAYGSQTRRTYGVLGSEANISSRLMSRAAPGQILVSKYVAEAAVKHFQFTYLETSPVKGRTEPIPIFEVIGRQTAYPHLTVSAPPETTSPEVTQILDAVLAGHGQVVRLDSGGENPLAMLKGQAVDRGLQIEQGNCQGQANYSPWREIFRARFNLTAAPQEKEDRTAWTKYQISQVEAAITALNPDWLPLLPLLGDLLGLPIPDNDTTAIFNPILRQGTLFALVMEIVKTWAANRPFLLLIEEAQRLDEPAQGLTLALARSLTSAPVLLVLAHPPTHNLAETLLGDLSRLPNYHQLSRQTRPAASQAEGWLWTGASPLTTAPLIGRSTERMLLTGQLQALLRGNAGGAVLIEGEAGIGKSRLVADLLQQAQAQGVTCLIGGGEAIEQSTPYHAWRPLFQQLFKLDHRATAGSIPALLTSKPDLARLAPLLNTILPLGLPENELTRQMSGQVRADNTRDLLLNLLQEATAQTPALLVLEDAHWLDSASWALTRLVSQRVPGALLVVATRPLSAPLPIEYSQLLQTPGLQRLTLEALSPEETLTLVCQRLGANNLPDPVATLIRTKAEGHPFFSEELAYALRDSGLIQIEAGECRLVSEMGAFDSVILPDTVEEVITSRIDRLNPSQQIILKVASVIGRTFLVELLRDIHPNQAEKPRLPTHLGKLAQLDITQLDHPEPDLTYTFKHAITREVAYNLMLFDQRRDLHRAVAEWVEHTYAADLPPFYALLAHHWSQALGTWSNGSGSVTKAIDYLEKAGEQALRGYANQEAVRFLGEAVVISETHFESKQGRRGAGAQGGEVSSAPLLPRSPAPLRGRGGNGS
ncbi:MAG: AAA family ATPase, partial [Anaerolineales bacterium]|nr:AAA family ATPase [Anaerolineales bacterium]